MQSLLILGRQPELGIAELESLYGADKIKVISSNVVLLDVDPCLLAFDRLGGSIKFAKVLTKLETTNWREIEDFIIKVSPDQTLKMPAGKMTLGLSLYGFNQSAKNIINTGIKIKREIQKTDRSVRLVPNQASELNSAQVIHNKLTRPNGWELLFIKSYGVTYVAQTVKVQDIKSYSLRDRNRPYRDSRIGMLPPKLAQIIINLASGLLPEELRLSVCDIPEDEIIPITDQEKTILDPFCGTGVILQEALLMGYKVIGSDIDPRMIDYSKKNLDWLTIKIKRLNQTKNYSKDNIFVGDAINTKWPKFDFIASETFLGKPMSSSFTNEQIAHEINICNTTIKSFLKNLLNNLDKDSRLCLAVPAWQVSRNQFKHLSLIDQLDDLGYNQLSFKSINTKELIYIRPDQIVARQLLVLKRK